MLVIGGVVVAGCQHHAGWRADRSRRHRLHRLEQAVGIAVDRRDAEFAEQLGTQPQHRLAILQHVADARGGAGIVLQHEEIVGTRADQVDAADMRPDAVRRPHAGDLRPELWVAEDQVLREHALLQDAALAIDVVEKGVDRLDPLDEPGRQPCPFVGQEHAGHNVERDDPLRRVIVAIHRKGDAELAEGGFLRPAGDGGVQRGPWRPASGPLRQCRPRWLFAAGAHDLVERLHPHPVGKTPL